MGIALLLLGLLPLVFLPDLLDSHGGSDDVDPDLPPSPLPIDGDPPDDLASLLDESDQGAGQAGQENILTPTDEDDPPDDGSQNPDPQDILLPIVEDDVDTPADGDVERTSRLIHFRNPLRGDCFPPRRQRITPRVR